MIETHINGINVPALKSYIEEVKQNPKNAMIDYKVNLQWQGGTKSKVTTKGIQLGDQSLERNFSFIIDEPEQILGENTNPTPQEYLLGGMGACMIVGYSVGASVMGITLDKLEIDLEAGLDLRGFLEVDPEAPIGFKDVNYTIRVKGNGTKEQYEKIHQTVIKASPNLATIANAITIVPEMVIED
ncbi:OsmC family protein [Peribacillus frigoritolerans]|uniref:OsmC family protein n=1 Tax=Peribacillus frigoritolerans TaxID=450367 RepID=UPI000FD81B53|nr:OsmC family protein [Peribacillus frigoritolerans]AZV59419.1 OsmC family peroxiredoxin [Peribacillus frigoritolerans]